MHIFTLKGQSKEPPRIKNKQTNKQRTKKPHWHFQKLDQNGQPKFELMHFIFVAEG